MILMGLAAPTALGAPEPIRKPKVEVVFCLDTTGSMGGLIDGAKAKIWAICNQIAGAKPTPELKVGLVAYRDKGDSYVTQVHDLTGDLDAIHAKLKTFTADGGGDEPEHVNQALHDAVNKIKWSDDKKVMKIIFLVGDAAPHMDYTDDVKYPETCKKAVGKGIIINTIQCGTSAECTKYWKDIAVKSEGSYAAIPQAGGVVAIDTPFDARLAEINSKLTRTVVLAGDMKARRGVEERLDAARKLAAPAAADRAGFAGKTGEAAGGGLGAPGGPRDLIADAVDKDGKADLKKLKEVKEEELPEELKKLKTEKERAEFLEKRAEERAKLNKEAIELDKKRSAFIAAELKKKGKDKDSFDSSVLNMLKKQSKKFEIEF
jgi:Mg-chelatase subunit ChlD